MNKKDVVPLLASAPPEGFEDWKSPFIMVNGSLLSVEDYRKNPTKYNSAPIPQEYLETVCQQTSHKLIQAFNLDLPFILQKNKTPKED